MGAAFIAILCLTAISYGIKRVRFFHRCILCDSLGIGNVTMEGPAEICITGIFPGMMLIIGGVVGEIVCLVYFIS